MEFETLVVEITDGIATVRLNRPTKANAINAAMWKEIPRAFAYVDETPRARVAILEGEGKHFTAGIDLAMLTSFAPNAADACEGRAREALRRLVLELQDTLTAIERCRKPVIASIAGGCVGGGVDMICCTDMRFCSSDAYFTIKEIELGMVADVGTLQRLPKLIGNQGIVRELAYTGRKVEAAEARDIGLVNRVFESRDALHAGVRDVAKQIAARSPLSIRGTKEMLQYTRDHSVADGLNYIATWNAAMFLSADLKAAVTASMTKADPKFED